MREQKMRQKNRSRCEARGGEMEAGDERKGV
jgi:hypothetical protein